MTVREVNFDGLVGPTHNYAGLSWGNVASLRHARQVSNPRQAALQGLAKMKTLLDLGLPQALLPPHPRPDVDTLRRLGFRGSDGQVLAGAARHAPALLAACSSASAMWTANAATVSPGADTADGRVHVTPANLVSKFHRAMEPAVTARLLRAIFPDPAHFAHHAPLPGGEHFADEGAANHTRLCGAYGEPGVELFTYGRSAFTPEADLPTRFPARQTREAGEAIARLHGLNDDRTLLMRQNPAVIDQGVFHNDVIAVGNGNVLLYHRQAFADTKAALHRVRTAFGEDRELWFVEVPDKQVSVSEAVGSYLFNSQLVTLSDGHMALIAPSDCRNHPRVAACLDEVAAGHNPIRRVIYLDVRESMRNGGGPACLRLRVVLTEAQQAAAHQGVFLTPERYRALCRWVERHYRDRLAPEDLADPQLLEESRRALDELTGLLGLGALYPFQDT